VRFVLYTSCILLCTLMKPLTTSLIEEITSVIVYKSEDVVGLCASFGGSSRCRIALIIKIGID